MTASALLAHHRPPDVASVWERAADVCGTLAAARQTREGRALLDLFDHEPAAGEAALVRYSECDPIHVPSCATVDAVAVPVARAAAVDAEAFLQAVWVAGAVGVRLATAVGGVAALAKGVWPGLLVAPAVAAVADALARRRPQGEVEHALALAASGVSGRSGRPGGMPSGRWVLFADATAKGLAAARAAACGAAGDRALISPEWLEAQSPGLSDPAALEGVQGEAGIGLKPVVAARQGMTAVAALQEVLAGGVRGEDIRAINVALPPVCLPVVTRPLVRGERLSEIANLPLALALAALAPERLLDIARETPLPDAALRLAEAVTVRAAEDMPAPAGLWPARLRIETSAGPREIHRDRMPGDPGAQGRREMLRHKLSRLGATGPLSALDGSGTSDPDRTLARLRAKEGGLGVATG